MEEHNCYEHLIEIEHPSYVCAICDKDIVIYE